MIIVMQGNASDEQISQVIERLTAQGFDTHLSRGVERTIIGVIGDNKEQLMEPLEVLPGVERIVRILQPFKLASKEFKKDKTMVQVGDVTFGGPRVPVIAGPCAVENEEQILSVAWAVKRAGGSMLRGGAYKPRTSPYAFQGLEEEGLKLLAKAREETGLPFVTEVVNPNDVAKVAEYADMLQIGARNMQNFVLLREVGHSRKPVLLKRGLAATIEEWLMAAEYIISAGNYNVVLCERGIRTYETATRNTLDISAIPEIQRISHLPVLADPSHGTGRWRLVGAMAKAAVAAGADGLLIEVHTAPDKALSDGPQSLTPDNFHRLMEELGRVAAAVDRCV
ncbi:MAG: 3-deoxy-7-phosphoheptulonate synthase [Limnochordia bacterium]|jgi:3-deoxy-7-phosphoheptulonate synthase